MKTCSKCGESKALECFYRRADGVQGRHGQCKECIDAKNRGWAVDNKVKLRALNVDRRASFSEGQRERARIAAQRRAKKRQDELTDSYVSIVLGISPSVCPKELIQAKREQLSLHRLTKELKQEITNQLENRNGN